MAGRRWRFWPQIKGGRKEGRKEGRREGGREGGKEGRKGGRKEEEEKTPNMTNFYGRCLLIW